MNNKDDVKYLKEDIKKLNESLNKKTEEQDNNDGTINNQTIEIKDLHM